MSLAEAVELQHPSPSPKALDVQKVREDFPILKRQIRNKPLVYLDNAASTQKPRQVIETVKRVYEEDYANIHRGVHYLSQRATDLYEEAREKVRGFLNAKSTREIIFVRGATEGINLVAATFADVRVGEGDEIVITGMEHHSNIVPWQILCEKRGATLKVVPIDDHGQVHASDFEATLSDRTKLVGIVHVSNALGTVTPIKHFTHLAHQRGIPVLVDGAQSSPHVGVDVQDVDCDFFVFSGHKIYGPTGVGVLYGKEEHLEKMPPYQGGGDMIASVTFEKTTYNELPYKFEAGTPNIAGGIGLGAAIDYIQSIGIDNINAYEQHLLSYATSKLETMPGVRIIGTAPCKAGVVSFMLDGVHPHDIGTILDQEGIAIRTGHHCAQPVMERFCIPATARASLGLYNTEEEIDALVKGLGEVASFFG